MLMRDVGVSRNVAIDELVIRRRMTVGVHVKVTDVIRRRHVMTAAECIVHNEGKRRHHR